ncbi:methyltransferase [Tenggerimyces flavus]|uniref:Methyltransferase n=1 Tax=Tenggerimyces flavus TaxID=1708749 RepID=A0ABV7YAI9_9ACTN|nr:methyltransferase [Tenggerimyces flavus]MBM7785613.1 protein-S-isoprenylcysteine O-methyltransferase Ste14 [Tenggerimyces flavus]
MIAQRFLTLLVTIALVVPGLCFDRTKRGRAGALLGFIAAAVGIAASREVADDVDGYGFASVDGAFRGMPVDLWLAWAALWGALPVLYRRVLPLPVAMGILLWLDLTALQLLHPLVQLERNWLPAELVSILAIALPAALVGRWTADRRRLGARIALQMAVFAGATLWLLPTIAFEYGDGAWTNLTELPRWAMLAIAQLAFLLSLPALLAVYEFAVRGNGTPYPWDPPDRLVTTGPYAYVGNPMQLSAVALLALLAATTQSLALAAGVGAAIAFGIGVADPHERYYLATTYGKVWRTYDGMVPNWWPRWRPYATGPPATLWLDDNCTACRAIRDFLAERDPQRLVLAPAHLHRPTLWRARYVSGDGHQENGVAAIARGLEHLHLGWAFVGWFLRLPGVRWLAQLVADAMIAAPHAAAVGPAQGGGCPPTPSSGC